MPTTNAATLGITDIELPFNPWFGGGNYYGDYSGVDEFSGPWQNLLGSDGIGDDAYTILGNNGNYDPYPFMNEYGWHIRLWEEGGWLKAEITLEILTHCPIIKMHKTLKLQLHH